MHNTHPRYGCLCICHLHVESLKGDIALSIEAFAALLPRPVPKPLKGCACRHWRALLQHTLMTITNHFMAVLRTK